MARKGLGRPKMIQKIEAFLNSFYVQLLWRVLVLVFSGLFRGIRAFLGWFTENRQFKANWRRWDWKK
jgi:hypothetical protein